jgi:hypothetical protein
VRAAAAGALALVAAALAPPPSAAGERPGHSAAAPGERIAHWAAPGCDVALEARGNEPVLMLRPGCALDLDATVRALAALLAELYPDRRIADVASLSLGRIERLPWLAERVAAAARSSPRWDARAGRAREGSAERAVGDWIRDGDLARELSAVLASFGATTRGASAEKVLVRSTPGDRVPFDAVVWLRLGAP